ncbi:3-deoxy-manno-octulosonate cytidylyltransferase [Kiritimatiella glycovorans]|uniref:3-deoxy-manno-octulosonate cytidylyltransferase n=1 Tax=Kiritimatiella glycovorans TaxID=1307763 RepID=A0A0G3EC28_9BACT|nr:3-deoxy-manno-octulosonate cytidylyltransferase [Kiritimatiella glycovorans]AKJ64051.1 3-deoxy-manno-octulosonate cytidylyltransferase [Kiritimatiella glycovorans]
MTRAIGVIPARWASTRFPGKVLAPVAGRPLLYHVLDRVRAAGRLAGVRVATDDDRVREAVEAYADGAVQAVMTRPGHPSGTDRVAEAVGSEEAEVIVNIQGDEPLIEPALIDRLAAVLTEEQGWDMATAASPMSSADERIRQPSVVKVVCDARGRALYFSRAAIPHVRDADESLPEPLYWRHIGIYAYRRPFLLRMVAEAPDALERAEKLEQLRALRMGAAICVLRTEDYGTGVDTPEDVERVERVLNQNQS